MIKFVWQIRPLFRITVGVLFAHRALKFWFVCELRTEQLRVAVTTRDALSDDGNDGGGDDPMTSDSLPAVLARDLDDFDCVADVTPRTCGEMVTSFLLTSTGSITGCNATASTAKCTMLCDTRSLNEICTSVTRICN
jgi:hypothetical protein